MTRTISRTANETTAKRPLRLDVIIPRIMIFICFIECIIIPPLSHALRRDIFTWLVSDYTIITLSRDTGKPINYRTEIFISTPRLSFRKERFNCLERPWITRPNLLLERYMPFHFHPQMPVNDREEKGILFHFNSLLITPVGLIGKMPANKRYTRTMLCV